MPSQKNWSPRTWDDALCVVPPVLLENKPLAIGSRKALYALRKPGVSRVTVHLLIRRYVNTVPYLRALANGGKRFSLAGVPTEEIEISHRIRAAELLKECGISVNV